MNTKDRAIEVYKEHLALASTDGKLFRKTVMDQLMLELNISIASAATHYNNCKKAMPVEGLGRPPQPPGLRKVSHGKGTSKDIIPDDQCFSVLELVGDDPIVGRCQSFIMRGDASEKYDQKVEAWPACNWVMISGLGPNSGDSYKLQPGEAEIKRYYSPGTKVPA